MDHETLRNTIIDQHREYTKGFKRIARIIVDQPHLVAVQNITLLSTEAGVSPATLIRFINHLGFEGYSDFQQIFKQNLVSQFHNYQETLHTRPSKGNDAYGLLYEINEVTQKGMNNVLKGIDKALLSTISRNMHRADTIRLCAFRRLYPVCAYLYYTLTHMHRSVALIDGHAGLHIEQARQIESNDLLIVISILPYAVEAQKVAEIARKKKAGIVAVTDSELSPLCDMADQVLIINDIRLRDIRMPTITLNVLQALCLSLAFMDS